MAFGDGKRLNPVTTGSQQGEAEGVLQTISASSDDFRLCLPDDGMQASVVTVTAFVQVLQQNLVAIQRSIASCGSQKDNTDNIRCAID